MCSSSFLNLRTVFTSSLKPFPYHSSVFFKSVPFHFHSTALAELISPDFSLSWFPCRSLTRDLSPVTKIHFIFRESESNFEILRIHLFCEVMSRNHGIGLETNHMRFLPFLCGFLVFFSATGHNHNNLLLLFLREVRVKEQNS